MGDENKKNRADITSNTYWDWNLNHVGSAYGMMDEVFKFVATFKEFLPRSFPPSFNPANILESTLDDFKEDKRLKAGANVERLRGTVNSMLEKGLQEHGLR